VKLTLTRTCVLAYLFASCLAACSSPTPATIGGPHVCNDPLTGLCAACPGTKACVDPKTCQLITCDGQDTNLFGQDTGGAGDDVATVADAGALADTQTDTAKVDTAPPPQCKEGDKGCSADGVPQFCATGLWLKLNPCGKGHACKGGACTCAGECLAIGQQECIGKIDAIKKCKLVGTCLLWGVPQACAPADVCKQGACIAAPKVCEPACPQGHTCVKGICVPPSDCKPACSAGQICDKGVCVGTMGCGQVHACVSQFSQGPNDQLTVKSCLSKGTAAAQALYTKRKDCIAIACQNLIDAKKANEAMLCIYSKCGVEQGACLGSGAKTCSQMGNCLSACGASATCTIECHASSSVDAVKAWYTLTNCGDQFCAGMSGNAWAQCTTAKCQGAFNNCFGTTGGGGGGGSYSCNQILKCAGGCQDKACATKCKNQGSAQGTADLNAFLACQKKSCDSYCLQGSAAQCNACIKAYCATQDAKCGFTTL
jgi:hypothetical protein